MKRTSSDLNMVMTSSRAGARAARSRKSLWRKALLFILPLISLFSLVVCPATSVFAAYGTSFVPTAELNSNYVSTWQLDTGVTMGQTMTVHALGSVRFQANWTDQNLYADGYIASLIGTFDITASSTNLANWNKHGNAQIEIISVEFDTAFYDSQYIGKYLWSGQAQVNLRGSTVNQRQTFGAIVSYRVTQTYTYSPTSGTDYSVALDALLQNKPSIVLGTPSASGEYMSLQSLLPDLQKIRQGLLDPTTGWLPTMNTNLQSMVTNQITANSWLQTMVAAQNTTNSHLTSVRNNQSTIIANQESQLSNEEIQLQHEWQLIQGQQTEIANQETQISQLQEIVDYINNTEAASVLDDANDEFTDQAAAMESGQAALEEDADDNIDAVDVAGNLAVVTTYRQSLNFWMRCVNYLPTATGSIWEAFVFGVFLAFILFILRLNK